ncbi:MAG TPA: signal peptidase I [Gemmataceae bacterium]|nr:signal peptidase I [Gemmataceae bacterium]
MSVPGSTGRKRWVAVVLSLLATGLGHIYCGHIVTGLMLFLVSLLFAPVAVVVALLHPSTAMLIGLIASFLAVIGIYLFAVVDAYGLARRQREEYVPRDYNRAVVYVLFILVGVSYPPVIVHYLRSDVFEAFVIPTASEAPNILPGDRVLVNKLVLRGRYPQRGDVVVFHPPHNPRQNWIKRIIGLPGDTIAVRGNELYVNGKKLERDRVPAASLPSESQGEVFMESNGGRRYLVQFSPTAKATANLAEKKVPEAMCFVLGDNRNDSSDSRDFGFVPLGDVLGVFQYIYYPAEGWERFGAY